MAIFFHAAGMTRPYAARKLECSLVWVETVPCAGVNGLCCESTLLGFRWFWSQLKSLQSGQECVHGVLVEHGLDECGQGAGTWTGIVSGQFVSNLA